MKLSYRTARIVDQFSPDSHTRFNSSVYYQNSSLIVSLKMHEYEYGK